MARAINGMKDLGRVRVVVDEVVGAVAAEAVTMMTLSAATTMDETVTGVAVAEAPDTTMITTEDVAAVEVDTTIAMKAIVEEEEEDTVPPKPTLMVHLPIMMHHHLHHRLVVLLDELIAVTHL